MACQHLTSAFASLAPPRPSQQVHREECTLCFDDQDGAEGIDVCLTCFNGGCTNNGEREHARLHYGKTGHALVVNVKRRRKSKVATDGTQAPPPKKLAIVAESEEEKYEYETTPKCLACASEDGKVGGKVLPKTDKLEEVISGVMRALSSAQQSEVKAWEEEIVPCEHTRSLKQLGDPRTLEPSGLASCTKCDLTSNLWLCLTCGNLGCGRAQFGGVGGNSHGLTHFEETGHPVSVKQGTITAEGTADIYCYACNDARIDLNLASHLSHFGINVMDLSKTEKSMTELQLEQNLKFDFNMTGEDGKELEPLFGPGLTGLRNLGNSCYMASVLQTVFSLPAFHTRYLDAYRPHTAACTNPLPAACLECQLGKLADGLLTGRYSVPRAPEGSSVGSFAAQADVEVKDDVTDAQEAEKRGPVFQAGIRPSMFKALIGKGHEEFSTMRQQDADEFLKHLVQHVQTESRRLQSSDSSTVTGGADGAAPTYDPTKVFAFGLQQRLQCNECKRVRYTVEAQDAGLSLPAPLRVKPKTDTIVPGDDAAATALKGKALTEGENAESGQKTSSAAAKAVNSSDRVEYEPVDLRECLDIFTSPETLDYRCPACNKNVTATKQTLFTSFPQVLAVQVRRFQLVNWVPQKVDVPIIVPLEEFSLDQYLGTGKREDEEELPEGEAETPAGPTFDANAMAQLTGMGFPEVRCQRALLATGNNGDAEAAMNWLFAHMEDPDIDDPIDTASLAKAGGSAAASGPDTSMLEDMGFTRAQATKALRVNGNNPEVAVAWLFENPDDPGEDADAPDTASAPGPSSGDSSAIGDSSTLPARYRIKAFISHKGPSVHSGHYVAHIRKGISAVTGANPTGAPSSGSDENWTFFNDEKVVKAPFSSVSADAQSDVGVKGLSKLAYLYVFERQEA